MTLGEFNALTAQALADMNALAAQAGQTAYATAYKAVYDAAYQQHTAGVPIASQWMWEGDGFAGAWDATRNPPINRDDYNHSEHQTVYDASGRAHLVTTYYQKNPHSDNLWDYIVTCEPAEDGRLDANGRPVAGTSLAGLLQKGKITFDANGNIKDLEAQDLNPGGSRAAYVEPPYGGTGVV